MVALVTRPAQLVSTCRLVFLKLSIAATAQEGKHGRELHRTVMTSKMSIEESCKLPICNMAVGSIGNVYDIK